MSPLAPYGTSLPYIRAVYCRRSKRLSLPWLLARPLVRAWIGCRRWSAPAVADAMPTTSILYVPYYFISFVQLINDNFSLRIALVRVSCFLSNGRTSFNRVAAEMTLDHSKAMSSMRMANSQWVTLSVWPSSVSAIDHIMDIAIHHRYHRICAPESFRRSGSSVRW